MRFSLITVVTVGLAGLAAARPKPQFISTTPAAPSTTPRAPSTTPAAPSTTPRAPSTTPAAPTTTPVAPSTTPRAPSTTPAAPSTTPKLTTTSSSSSTTTSSSSSSSTTSSTTTSAACSIPTASCANPTPLNTYAKEPCFANTGFCYPTNYYAAQDEGQFTVNANGNIDHDVNEACRAACNQQPQCLAYVGVENINPNGLATATCFFYNTQKISPRRCSDAPSRLVAYYRETTCAAP